MTSTDRPRPSFLDSARAALLPSAVALFALFALASWLHPIKIGLKASYYANNQWAGAPLVSRRDLRPDTNILGQGWAAPYVFSVNWSGSLLVLRGGTYTIATTSDDGSWVVIDGRTVVDNRGVHSRRTVSDDVVLERGVHTVRIQYAQEGGDRDFHWAWARQGGALEPIPAWVTTSEHGTFGQSVVAAVVYAGLAASEWLLATVIGAGLLRWLWRTMIRLAQQIAGDDAGPVLWMIVIGSAVLGVTAIWWGMPGGHWAPDEINPDEIWFAVAARFSNGWGSRYPPLHFYVLALVSSPVWMLQGLGRVAPDSIAGDVVNTIVERLVSTVASVGTLVFLYATTRDLVGRRAGLFAAAQFALVAPFVYYSKMANLDVPYLFYFSVALWAYVRVIRDLRTADFVAYSAAAVGAMCTKDQAYGLLILPSLLIFARVRSSYAQSGARMPTWRTFTDRRMLFAVGLGLALFAAIHNLLFNWSGFLLHVQLSAGGARVGDYRLFPNTLAGQAALLRLSASIMQVASGWPLFLVALAGGIMMWSSSAHRRAALLVSAPMVSYYLALIAVLGFNYDRFMLPILMLAAVFGGFAMARLTEGVWRRGGIAIAVLAFAYSLPYAAAVDVAMLRDSRYRTEAALAALPDNGLPIGFVFPSVYYPRLSDAGSHEVTSVGDLLGRNPRYMVIDDEYAGYEPADSDLGLLLAGLRSGALRYRPIFHAPGGFWFRWLPWPHPELAGPRPAPSEPVTSSLRHISPTYTVYRRDP